MEGSLRRSVQASQVGSDGAPLYSKGSKALDCGRILRTHLWSTCLTSISSAMANAMGDVGDTQQRAAARSGIALAMERWGCREDPNSWQWGHLTCVCVLVFVPWFVRAWVSVCVC